MRTSLLRSGVNRGPGLLTYGLLLLLAALSFFPFYWMFVVASNDTSVINDIPPRLVPGDRFMDNIRTVFGNVPFGRALINSAIVATVAAVAQTFFSALAGYSFAKLRFKGRNVLFVIIIATMMVPLQLGVVPQFLLISRLGWVNDLRALIVPATVSAFGVFWMRQAVQAAVPDELIQAAKVDGAGTFRTFRSIVLPAVRPQAAVLALFAFMGLWNDFFWPLVVLNRQDSFTVQVALRQVQEQAYVTDYGVQMAGTVVGTVPLFIVFLIFGKQIVGGIMEGAIKG